MHRAPHTASGLSILRLDIFTLISNPDREPKHTFYRLSYFPSSTDLSVHIFEQNSKSFLLSLKRQTKASVIIAHIFQKTITNIHTDRGALPCMLLQAFHPPAHTYFGATEKEELYFSCSTFHTSTCVFLLL